MVEVKRPANITPCLDKITLAHWCRLTWVAGDVVIVFGDIFSNVLSIDRGFFHPLLNKRAVKSCALPHGQTVVFLIIASQNQEFKMFFFYIYYCYLLSFLELAPCLGEDPPLQVNRLLSHSL